MIKDPVDTILSAARQCYLGAGICKTGMRDLTGVAGVAK